MAGEWIKLEATTLDKPEVLRIARMLKIDRDAALGKLVRLWSWFDANSVDGVVDGVVDADVDRMCFCPGFAAACVAVCWLVVDEQAERITLPNFDRHNGETAKQRALKNRRQANWRAGKVVLVDGRVDALVDTPPSTAASTREENKEQRAKAKPSAAPTALPEVPDWVPAEAWAGFVDMRRRERHPLTHRAATLVLRSLEKLRADGHNPGTVLDQSTRNGWRDVFAPRDAKPARAVPATGSLDDYLARAV